MDDTQQVTQPTTTDSGQNQTVPTMGDLAGMVPQAPTMPGGMPTGVGGDQSITGMTPPPAVEPSMPSAPMSSNPMPTDSMAATMPIATTPDPVAMPQPSQPAMPVSTAVDPEPATPAVKSVPENGDDYSYAEDILSEILDSLDRIEAKLEAIEKKTA